MDDERRTMNAASRLYQSGIRALNAALQNKHDAEKILRRSWQVFLIGLVFFFLSLAINYATLFYSVGNP